MKPLLVAWVGLAAGSCAQTLDLIGRIENCPGRSSVTLYGATTPFQAHSLGDERGNFRFNDLKPGGYTVSVFVPGAGEARQTVQVTPSFADQKGRVRITIPFQTVERSAAQAIKQQSTVSVRALSVSDKARAEYEKAQARLGRRDVEGAIKHLERAVELSPQFAVAWNNLGTIAYQTQRYPDAEKYFRRALDAQPGLYEPTVNLGGVLLNLNRPKEALDYNRYCVLERPGDALAHSQLGLTYFQLGDFPKAEEYLVKAKRMDPAHFSHPQITLTEVYLRTNRPEDAARELEEFLKHHPDDPRAAAIRGAIEKLRTR